VKKIVFQIIILILGAIPLLAQTNQMLRSQAVAAEKNKDWFSAQQYYSRLYFADSTNIKIQYAYAEVARLAYDLPVALYLYKKTAALDNGRRFPLAFYWMGQILKTKQNYKEAKKWFTKFYKLDLKKEKYQYYKIKSKLEMEACDLSQILMKQAVLPAPEHLDASINSKLSEYSAFERDSNLYFSSIRVPERKVAPKNIEEAQMEADRITYSKIYRSDNKNQKWKKIKVLDTLINANRLHTANACFNDDMTQMVISRCVALNASEYRCDLYTSSLKNKKWSNAVKMAEPINQPSVSTTQPNFGKLNGKEVLFFASDRAGGEGGLDIWYSVINENGAYEKPINAGKNINTPDDDITPWFVSKDSTLFFSSTYPKGFGGFDIYKSEFKNFQFNEIQNVGYPINSSFNDVYFTTNTTGTRIYLSSNRVGSYFEGKQNCCNDIYRFALDTLSEPEMKIDTVLVFKEKLKLLVPLTLYFHNDEPDPKTKNTSTTKNYETTYNDYKVLSPEYLKEYTTGLKGNNKELAANRISNFFTDSVEAGIDGLRQFTDLLEKVVKNGETVKITLKGYCSPLASTDYNINLAKRRISSLRNYFTEAKGGVLVKYVNNQTPGEGTIIFENVDIGELPATKTSDNLKDKRNSVYSPTAASERKIQIIAVSYGQ